VRILGLFVKLALQTNQKLDLKSLQWVLLVMEIGEHVLLAPKLHVIDLATVEATTGLRAAIFVTELEHQHVELKRSALQIVQALKK
jgi:hypothetical protein